MGGGSPRAASRVQSADSGGSVRHQQAASGKLALAPRAEPWKSARAAGESSSARTTRSCLGGKGGGGPGGSGGSNSPRMTKEKLNNKKLRSATPMFLPLFGPAAASPQRSVPMSAAAPGLNGGKAVLPAGFWSCGGSEEAHGASASIPAAAAASAPLGSFTLSCRSSAVSFRREEAAPCACPPPLPPRLSIVVRVLRACSRARPRRPQTSGEEARKRGTCGDPPQRNYFAPRVFVYLTCERLPVPGELGFIFLIVCINVNFCQLLSAVRVSPCRRTKTDLRSCVFLDVVISLMFLFSSF